MGKRTEIAKIILLVAIVFILSAIYFALNNKEAAEAVEIIEPTYAEPIELEEYTEDYEFMCPEVNQGPIYVIDEEERDLIERIVAAEARGESMACMMACAQTIRDRCITRKQSVSEVCLAKNQFAAPYEGRIIDRIKDSVSFVFDYGYSVYEFPVTHFYASHLIDAPEWSWNMTALGEIDGVTFLRSK